MPFTLFDHSTFEGVLWCFTEQERHLPQGEQYIHSYLVQDNIRICVTMHPRVAREIHSAVSLACDFTFKRVAGNTNEYAISGWSSRYQCRKFYHSYSLN
jgi:hypothetical protein